MQAFTAKGGIVNAEYYDIQKWYQEQLALLSSTKQSSTAMNLNIEYSKKLSELTTKGWNEQDHKNILTWYQNEVNKVNSNGVFFVLSFVSHCSKNLLQLQSSK